MLQIRVQMRMCYHECSVNFTHSSGTLCFLLLCDIGIEKSVHTLIILLLDFILLGPYGFLRQNQWIEEAAVKQISFRILYISFFQNVFCHQFSRALSNTGSLSQNKCFRKVCKVLLWIICHRQLSPIWNEKGRSKKTPEKQGFTICKCNLGNKWVKS